MASPEGSDPSHREIPFNLTTSLEAITLVLWEVLLVLFWMIFSPAGGNAYSAIGLPISLLYRIVSLNPLFVHSLAMPLAGILVIVTTGIFGMTGGRRQIITHAVTAGCLISSAAMVFIPLVSDGVLAYAVMVFGMGLTACAALALFLSLWPRRAPSAPMRLMGFSLTQLAIWAVVAAALASVAAGSYAALGDSLWFSKPLLEALPSLEATHEGLIIAFLNAAIVVLIVKWFGADRYLGAPGLLVKIGLYGVLVGTPAVALFALLAMPTITVINGEFFIVSSIPMQAAVFVMCAVMVQEARRLRMGGPLAALGESLAFGLLFLLYWADAAVTLPAVYVFAHLKGFTNQPFAIYYLNTFQTGIEHALVTLTAILLFMLVALVFGVKGKVGALAGLSLTVGYVVCTTANLLFIFNLMTNGQTFFPFIEDGIFLMVIGVMLALGGIFASNWRRTAHL